MKKVIAAVIAVLLIIPAGFAFAQGNGSADKTQKAQLKSDVKTKIAAMKESLKSNKELRAAIKNKRSQVKNLVKGIKGNKGAIAPDKLSQIKAQLKTVKSDAAALKALTPDKTDKQTLKADRKNKNYEAVLNDLNNISSLQQNRTNALNKLSSDLDALLSTLNSQASVQS